MSSSLSEFTQFGNKSFTLVDDFSCCMARRNGEEVPLHLVSSSKLPQKPESESLNNMRDHGILYEPVEACENVIISSYVLFHFYEIDLEAPTICTQIKMGPSYKE